MYGCAITILSPQILETFIVHKCVSDLLGS